MSHDGYRIQRFRSKFAIVFERAGKRHRHTLGTANASEARALAPKLYAELTRPRTQNVGELWESYLEHLGDRAVAGTMRYTWKALAGRFSQLSAGHIRAADCQSHTRERRRAGINDGTIHTELGHLRTVLRWAEKQGLIDKAPHIERPPKPRPKEAHLSRSEARNLVSAATSAPHVAIFITIALATGARSAAILDLKWSRCDFDRGLIDLRNPELNRPHKGRAIVPMNQTLRAALLQAKESALSEWVIEWAGKKVKSVKRGLQTAATRAGLGKVTPHMLRHSAAVHMAEAGIPMSEIAQFLGHSTERETFKTYARFSPDFLRKAAKALEYD